MTRQTIYQEIDWEREAQDQEYGSAHDDALTPHQWVGILTRHLGLSLDDAGVIDPVRFRRQLVRVAAVAVAALESLARRCERPVRVTREPAWAEETTAPAPVVEKLAGPPAMPEFMASDVCADCKAPVEYDLVIWREDGRALKLCRECALKREVTGERA